MNPAQFHPTHSRKAKNGAWVPEWNSPAVLAFRECPVMKCRCIFSLPSLPLLVSFDRLAVFHRGGIVALIHPSLWICGPPTQHQAKCNGPNAEWRAVSGVEPARRSGVGSCCFLPDVVCAEPTNAIGGILCASRKNRWLIHTLLFCVPPTQHSAKSNGSITPNGARFPEWNPLVVRMLLPVALSLDGVNAELSTDFVVT